MIGANGSGKSTLTGLTVGLRHADQRTRSASAASRSGPGKVFEQAAHVALLLQAADEMLFEETVSASWSSAPVPGPAARAGAGRGRSAIEFFGFRGLRAGQPLGTEPGRPAAAGAGRAAGRGAGRPGPGRADHRAGRRADAGVPAAARRRVRERTGLTVLTVTHDIRGLASRAARVVLLGRGPGAAGRADGARCSPAPLSWNAGACWPRRWPGSRWNCSAPGADVLLDPVGGPWPPLAHRDSPRPRAGRGPAGQP